MSISKKIVLISLFILIATTLYVYVIPNISFKKETVSDPEIAQAILEFTNSQMGERQMRIPIKTSAWKVESITILDIKELPGSQNKRRVKCRLNGGYKSKGDFGTPDSSHSFYQKNTFLISDKYPSGINVQLEK